MATKKKAVSTSSSRKPSASSRNRDASRTAQREAKAKTGATTKPRARKTALRTQSTPTNTTRGRVASPARADAPELFRINIEVGNLDEAARFYAELLGIDGRPQRGGRIYFTAGAVTLQVVDVASAGMGVPHPAAKALYFVVDDLDAVFARAERLQCLSREMIHGASGGAIAVRPWGERSFYVEDKWRNPLCFVQAGTIYPG